MTEIDTSREAELHAARERASVMTGFHSEMRASRQREIEEAVGDLILAFADHYRMTVPSAVYALNQITTRQLAGMDKFATAKNLRQTADFISGKVPYSKFFEASGRTFDRIAAGYDQKQEQPQ